MKFRVYRYCLWSIVLLGGCKSNEPLVTAAKDNYKADLLSRMIVSERYWRVEQIIQITGKDSVFIKYNREDPQPIYWMGATGYRFLDNMQLDNINSFGVSGDQPYGDQRTFNYMSGSYELEDGKWLWDEEKQTIAVEGFYSIRDVKGYLDKGTPPVCRNLQEAMALGKPERVNFIFPPVQGSGEDAIHVYCLRAAWPVERLNYSAKSVTYRVLY